VSAPKSAAHIRLHDGKAGKISGPLRDDRIVGRCLLGLADGRRLMAQVLDAPEQMLPTIWPSHCGWRRLTSAFSTLRSTCL
jgi:hypothetical protein